MSWEKVSEDVSKGPFGAFKWFFIFIVLIGGLFTGLSHVTRPMSVVVDRLVTKQSFQYKEGMEQRAAILQATLAEIDLLLQSNPENREDLIKQKMIISAQLKAITVNQ